ncbi:hypothetical protein BEWA_054070 [Theileria equi strain WA]|uniref:Plus3 domain-containing protein n=1 Tax=Theileria equi strain WA TaxID=1537102 RepID=L1LDD1_THEEQ|nr:hypothetical protein BEWA_054070 [Theileria equi strain WA]EKX73351.1 hypothetical protein BEWA_054070 [Theileria equi strain WA]|eukprot:XP_004832803.1 hypothetical protein BEWA_054070 [Theileria equi strain WA]
MPVDLSDVSSLEDESMPEFRREMILAEKHAEKLKIQQRQDLLGKQEVKDASLDVSNMDLLDDGSESEDEIPSENLFFQEDTPVHLDLSLANSTRLSQTRLMNMLEHPNCNDYVIGALLNVFVTSNDISATNEAEDGGRSGPSGKLDKLIHEVHPYMLGHHVVFQIDSIRKVKRYEVHGSKYGRCTHENIDSMAKLGSLGKCEFKIVGKVLSSSSGGVLSTREKCICSVSDICNAPFVEEAMNFGDDKLARDLQIVSSNLQAFTFTDEDVQAILERKLLEQDGDVGSFKGRSGLIAAIQRISHEIELLVEAAKNDPSQLSRLAEREKKKQELEEQLKNFKVPTKIPVFVKNSAILRASDDLVGKGVTRKTTKPTPMIMVPTMKTESSETEASPTASRFTKSLENLPTEKQEELISAYLSVRFSCLVYNVFSIYKILTWTLG